MSTSFALDHDVTRWGAAPSGGGLDQRARDFLDQHVGAATPPVDEPAWDDVRVPPGRLSAESVGTLAAIVGSGALKVDDASRRRHAGGLSYLDLLARRRDEITAPDAVVFPRTAAQVAAVLAWCETNDVAVLAFGGGTSVVGGLRTEGVPKSSISLDMSRMADLIDVDAESHLARVGPGMTGPDLERLLAPRGFTLGHYPQSWHRASIGGYAATRSAGQASTGYGRSDDMIESLEVVTPRGTIRVGRVAASAAGPDLRALFVGSEGAFGVITEVTLRIRSVPAARSYTAVMFPDYESGVQAFRQLAQQRVAADVMRLSDPQETAVTMAMSGPGGRGGEILDRYLRVRRVTDPSLAILGWEGSRASVVLRRLEGLSVLRRNRGISLGPTVGDAWLRHRFDGPFLRDDLLDAGYLVETLETATHWSRVADLRTNVSAALADTLSTSGRAYVMSHLSHVYETGASLYFTVVAVQDARPGEQWRLAKAAATEVIVDHGATITHHHGVGRDHAPWLPAEIGAEGVGILAAVKHHLDPQGILNPGVLGLD
ncbi:MAG: FAD-binding oxidoreductase [Actinobacteria bacterium]|nr:FAD-binding oxidoreductase [Actinomycetota bacterium]